MTNYEIVKKLIGEIRPAGDASIDPDRLENLKAMCDLHAEIHEAIQDVAKDFKNNYQSSMKIASDFANQYLNNLGIKRHIG